MEHNQLTLLTENLYGSENQTFLFIKKLNSSCSICKSIEETSFIAWESLQQSIQIWPFKTFKFLLFSFPFSFWIFFFSFLFVWVFGLFFILFFLILSFLNRFSLLRSTRICSNLCSILGSRLTLLWFRSRFLTKKSLSISLPTNITVKFTKKILHTKTFILPRRNGNQMAENKCRFIMYESKYKRPE